MTVEAQSPRSTLLYATDFEASARGVLPQVEALARALGSQVHLLHVRPSGLEAFVSSGLAAREAEDRLAAVAKRIGEQGVATSSEVLSRVAVEVAIARSAAEQQAELIVVGAHERESLLESSAMMRIVRAAAQPVWIARGSVLPRKVLCGVDLSDESGDAMRLAATIARRLAASLTIASAVELPAVNPTGLEDRELEEQEARHRANREREIGAFVAAQGIAGAEVVCRWGTADGVLVSLAIDEGHDLIVLGRRHSRDLRALVVGSTARRVIARAPCSVLVVGEGRRR